MKYEFKGKHYIASFKNCQVIPSSDAMPILKTALEMANTSIITHTDFMFENNGYTCVFLLRESHCSIHTYPEYNSMFVDLFTCGDKCDIDIFHKYMVGAFKPADCKFEVIIRE